MIISDFGYEIEIGWEGDIRSMEDKLSRQSGKASNFDKLYLEAMFAQFSKRQYIKKCRGVSRKNGLYWRNILGK